MKRQQVVFDTYAAEVAVFVYFVEIQEIGVGSLLAPQVYKVGNEIDSRFVGNYKAFFQAASETQGVCAELVGRTNLIVESYVHLSEPFHVVDVHSHHVAQSVRQEKCVCSRGHSVVYVAAH